LLLPEMPPQGFELFSQGNCQKSEGMKVETGVAQFAQQATPQTSFFLFQMDLTSTRFERSLGRLAVDIPLGQFLLLRRVAVFDLDTGAAPPKTESR
jgi:hypothetical protein